MLFALKAVWLWAGPQSEYHCKGSFRLVVEGEYNHTVELHFYDTSATPSFPGKTADGGVHMPQQELYPCHIQRAPLPAKRNTFK